MDKSLDKRIVKALECIPITDSVWKNILKALLIIRKLCNFATRKYELLEIKFI